MWDVGLHHRAINPELPAAGDLQRAGQLNGAVVERGDGLGADHVRPADEGSVVGNLLQIKAAELAQNYGVVDEALGLLVAEVVEPLYYVSILKITSTGVECRPHLPELGWRLRRSAFTRLKSSSSSSSRSRWASSGSNWRLSLGTNSKRFTGSYLSTIMVAPLL